MDDYTKLSQAMAGTPIGKALSMFSTENRGNMALDTLPITGEVRSGQRLVDLLQNVPTAQMQNGQLQMPDMKNYGLSLAMETMGTVPLVGAAAALPIAMMKNARKGFNAGKFGQGGMIGSNGEKVSQGLAMDRGMDGYDMENIIYSGTDGESATEILPYGTYYSDKSPTSQDNTFGGIFGSFDEDVAVNHGDTIQKFATKNHIDVDDFNHAVFYDDILQPQADRHFRAILKEYKNTDNITDDEVNELLDYAMGHKDPYDTRYQQTGDNEFGWVGSPEMGTDRYEEITSHALDGSSGAGDAGWDWQGIKGELARRMGYDSVGMIDEHGESVLVLNGKFLGSD